LQPVPDSSPIGKKADIHNGENEKGAKEKSLKNQLLLRVFAS
jgi:hypothetical protein